MEWGVKGDFFSSIPYAKTTAPDANYIQPRSKGPLIGEENPETILDIILHSSSLQSVKPLPHP